MKLKHKHFLFWWSGFLSLFGGLYFAYEAELLDLIWQADATKLSFVILAFFLAIYARLGYFIYLKDVKKQKVTSFDLEPGFEAADQAMALGMLGTVIGFIIMSRSFATVDFSNVENIKELLVMATSGMSTALYTTVSGLIASIIIRLSYYIFERTLDA